VTDRLLTALAELRFNSAPTPDDVWKPSPFHVPELHKGVVDGIFDGVATARGSDDSSPLGVVVRGRSGSGKTHMLGMVRERIHRDTGYFFLVSLLHGKKFWESVAIAMVEGLLHDGGSWKYQLTAFLRRLTPALGLDADVRDALAGSKPLTRPDLDAFIAALRRYRRDVGQEAQDTARAMVLYGSEDFEQQDIGLAYLSSVEPGDPADRSKWGIGPSVRTPQLIVRDITRLLALDAPIVIAIDQVDTLFAQSLNSIGRKGVETVDPSEVRTLLGQVADGLMELRQTARRTLTVVACLPDTWELIKKWSATPVPDRFRELSILDRIPTQEIGEILIAKRLTLHYAEFDVTPPYATWPVLPGAFADAPDFTPRSLLKRVEQHIRSCVGDQRVTELGRLDEGVAPIEDVPVVTPTGSDAFDRMDVRFAELRAAADLAGPLDPVREDELMPALLAAGLQAWIVENAAPGRLHKIDPPPAARPALHARLRLVLDEATEDESHWAFRAIASTSAVAVISRIRSASTMAGLDAATPTRRLILLRRSPWPRGPKTAEVVNALTAAGGRAVSPNDDDIATMHALRVLAAEADPALPAWLGARRPASKTELLRGVGIEDVAADQPAAIPPANGHGALPESQDPAPAATNGAGPLTAGPAIGIARPPRPRTHPDSPAPSDVLSLGRLDSSGEPLTLPLASLRKHMTIFAGSGSGKTVLIRRLVEECALRGVSSIVLDPNNDLARLGDGWPDAPTAWAPQDASLAEDYLTTVDVVVWTPRRQAGRPLAFQPLPDFSQVRDDADEFRTAIDAAVASLAPRAGVGSGTVKAQKGQAVLREALEFFGRRSGGDLRAFVEVLGGLPDGVSALANATKIASELAESLTAAMVNDPLFGGSGTAVDPGVLLTPPAGKRARVSVISFVGLTSDDQRQGFVNQLQMALFAWIKRNPAGDRPLGGLFVMDEAQTLAPASPATACTTSTLALVSQARKYGLGLVFATQAPKGLHNHIPGNSATQFYGLLNAPVQIATAREMAAAKGGAVPDIGLLRTGQFYAAREGHPFERIEAPLCLTYHPSSPLTPDEVIVRANRGDVGARA
jgi:hypothetical protein